LVYFRLGPEELLDFFMAAVAGGLHDMLLIDERRIVQVRNGAGYPQELMEAPHRQRGDARVYVFYGAAGRGVKFAVIRNAATGYARIYQNVSSPESLLLYCARSLHPAPDVLG